MANGTRRTALNGRDPALIAELAKHDALLSNFGSRVSSVEIKLDSIGSKLDQALNVLAVQQSRPTLTAKEILHNLALGVGLLGSAVAGILYVANNSSAVTMNALQTEIAGVKERSTIFNSETKATIGELKDNQQNSVLNLRERLTNIERYLLNSPRGTIIAPNEAQPQVFKPLPDLVPKRYRDERQL